MTAFLWAGCGFACASAIMFMALGMSKPRDWKYITFAGAMFFLASYFTLQQAFYNSDSLNFKIEVVRWQVNVALLYHGVFAAFLCLYSGWRPHRFLTWGAGAYLLILFVANWVSPYTLYFTAPPKISTITPIGADTIHLLEAPLNGFVVALFAFGAVTHSWGAYQIRRLQPGKKLVFAALMITLSALGLDLVRDAVGGNWPYSIEFATALLAMLMSLELAIDFRRKETQLARALDTTIHIRDQLNTPLQTLTIGLDLLPAETPEQRSLISRLRASVERLESLGRGLHKSELLKNQKL